MDLVSVIYVRALEHVFGCNPGEVCALTADAYEIEMKRARPRVEPVAAPASPAPPENLQTVDEVVAKPEAQDRNAKPRRNRAQV